MAVKVTHLKPRMGFRPRDNEDAKVETVAQVLQLVASTHNCIADMTIYSTDGEPVVRLTARP